MENEMIVVLNSGLEWNKPAQISQLIPTMAMSVAGNFQPLGAFTPYLSSYEKSEDPLEFMCTLYRGKWEDLDMEKDVSMGVAGSFTMIFLTLSVVLLLRSFYKRFNRLQKNEEDLQK